MRRWLVIAVLAGCLPEFPPLECTRDEECAAATGRCEDNLCVVEPAPLDPSLAFEPARVEFGVQPAGCPGPPRTVRLVARSDAQVLSVRVDAGSGFAFEGVEPPFSLGAAQTETVRVWFAPAGIGPREETLVARTGAGEARLALIGESANPARVVEGFVAGSEPDYPLAFRLVGSVEVRVAGSQVPEGQVWDVDRAESRLSFRPGQAPPRGAAVEVRYEAECR